MLLNLTDYSTEPLRDQISRQLISKIFAGELKFGDELLPVGRFASMIHASRVTVKRAYEQMIDLGVIENIKGKTFRIRSLSAEDLLRLQKLNISGADRLRVNQMRKIELEAARQIQSDLLPEILPESPLFSLDALSIPSEEVGGDFYDYLPLNEEEIVILIGDASGKGMPAALLISQIQAILKSSISRNQDIGDIVGFLNDYLNKNTSPKNFATLFFGLYNFITGELIYVNAGHNFPVIYNEKNKFELLRTTGPALGLGAKISYKTESVFIEKNSILFLYTDGVTESRNANREALGNDRLKKILCHLASRNPAEIIPEFMRILNEFRSLKYEQDDTTIMVLKRN